MNTLRRCHSMPLDIRGLDQLDPGLRFNAPTQKERRAESVRPPSFRSGHLYTGQPTDSKKSLTTIAPISPLLLDSQQAGVGFDVYDPVSSKREYSFKAEQGVVKELTTLQNEPQRREMIIENGEEFADADSSQSQLSKRISDAIHLITRDQQKVSGMRVQLAEMRSSLDENRTSQIYQWTNALKEVKSMLSNAPFAASVTIQLSSLETIHQRSDEYLTRENEYRNFQRRLEVEEGSLQQREAYMAELLREFSLKSHLTDSYMNKSHSKKASGVYQKAGDIWAITENESNASTVSAQMELHPLVGKYLSELGEIRMYKERLADLELEHAEITGRESSFALVDKPLDEESQEFLANYESECLELERIIAEKMDAAASLRKQCEKECIPLPSNLDKFGTELDFDIRKSLPKERDLLWISELDEDNTFYELAQSEDFNMYNFINTWIFHQLRHSTSQIHRYKSNPRLQGLQIDGDSLSEWAMKLWFQDENVKMASPLRTPLATE